MASWVLLRDSGTNLTRKQSDSAGRAGDSSLLVLNTHLDHGTPSTREYGVAVLRRWLLQRQRGATTESEAVVFMGDCNTHEDSEAYRVLLLGDADGDGSARGPHQLVDGYRQLHPQPASAEATAFPWGRPRLGAAPGRRIDYILHDSSALRAVSATIDRYVDPGEGRPPCQARPDATAEQQRGWRWPSDHHAVTATVVRRTDFTAAL
eukprot:COSAG01_NODE_7841_length_3030_cov_1.921528_4_plen_207_part_00